MDYYEMSANHFNTAKLGILHDMYNERIKLLKRDIVRVKTHPEIKVKLIQN